jgi:hypothetical protein
MIYSLTNSDKEQISLWANSILYNLVHVDECKYIIQESDVCLCNLARVLTIRPCDSEEMPEDDPVNQVNPNEITFNTRQYAYLTLQILLNDTSVRDRFCQLQNRRWTQLEERM